MRLNANAKDNIFNDIDNNFEFGTSFSFEIQTSGVDDTFTLPFISDGTYNCLVDWGDGSSDNITAYNQAEATHTYATENTYTIKITGTMTKFKFNNAGDKTMVTKFLSCTDTGLTNLDFYGCENLDTICHLGSLPSLTTAQYMFRDCNLSGALEIDIFDGCPNIANMYYCFHNNSLTALPDNFLNNCVLISNMAHCLQNNSLTALPDNFLNNCVNITNMDTCFYGNSFTHTLDSNMLANLTSCTTVQNCFNGNSSMTGSGLDFISSCPASITGGTTTNCFTGCTSLDDYASIPSAWGGGGA